MTSTTRTVESTSVTVKDVTLNKILTELLQPLKDTASKVLVTTSRTSSKKTQEFAEDLAFAIPNSTYVKNKHCDSLKSAIVDQLRYSHVITIFEDKKIPVYMGIQTPSCSVVFFKICDYLCGSNIYKKGKSLPDHFPELVLNNFNSECGQLLGLLFASMFPKNPQFRARQAVTFHNQRDFIFFRYHRYIFLEDGSRARLQELGPRFTLRLYGVGNSWNISKLDWSYDSARRTFLKNSKAESSSSQDNKVVFF